MEKIKELFSSMKIMRRAGPILLAAGLITLISSSTRVNAVSGHSMDPTLRDGGFVVTNTMIPINRFDIVTAKELDAESKEYKIVKRVIGLPGDEIEYKSDKLYVNGIETNEAYLDKYLNEFANDKLQNVYADSSEYQYTAKRANSFTFQSNDLETGAKNMRSDHFKVKVPENSYFLVGDNRIVSKDSRQIGFFPISNIIGKVIFAH